MSAEILDSHQKLVATFVSREEALLCLQAISSILGEPLSIVGKGQSSIPIPSGISQQGFMGSKYRPSEFRPVAFPNPRPMKVRRVA